MTHPYSTTLGIDVSKKYLDAHHSALKITKRYENTTQGIETLLQFIHTHPTDCILFEPSGGYERELLRSLNEKGLPFAMVPALHIRKFAQAKGQRAKTDSLDSALLAEYGLKMHPNLTSSSSHNLQALRLWTHRRAQVTSLIRLEKQHLEKEGNLEIIALIEENLSSFKNQLKLIDQEIEKTITQDPFLTRKASLLKDEKGIGDVCVATLLSYLPELGQANHKEIAALVGVAPYTQESGSWKGCRRISGGRRIVRSVLYMAVISAVRYNPKIKPFYERLKGKGKKIKVVLTACVRKLLIILNATLKRYLYDQAPCRS